jgi:putative transposase
MPPKENRFPQRKHPASGVIEITGQPTIVFDTVCTKDRTPWLACDEVHELLVKVWTEANAWLMGHYMIMPDHIHFFAGYRDGVVKYENWVKYWKSQFTKRFQRPECRWQTDDFDRRVRSAASYEEKWRYVRENPKRAGLVENSDDWPYQGEIHELRWD